MPTISVIVPVYKVEKYIHRCIDSILGQTFADFELILVDDGSPDNCGSICDEYAQKDSRVVVVHKNNGGLSDARNYGIDRAQGEWITFVDSDDWIHKQMLQHLLNAALEYQVDVSVCAYHQTAVEVFPVSNEEVTTNLEEVEQFYVTRNVNATVAWGKLYRRELFNNIRYPVGKIHEDEFTTYKILFAHDKIAFIPAQMYFYWVNPEGITKSEWNPKRMAAMEANEEQIDYFKNKQYEKASYFSEKMLLRHILEHYEICKKNGCRNLEIERVFQSYARRFLRCYAKDIKIDAERKVNLYWIAFPRIAKVYHSIKSAMRRGER